MCLGSCNRYEVDYTDGVSGKLFIFYGIRNFTLHFLSSCAHLLCSRSVAASHIAFSFDYMGIAYYLFNGSLSQCYISSEPSFAYAVHPWYPWMAILFSCFFYASETPQRYFPGMCDVIGHGHQIFHVVGSASLLTQMQAIFADLQNRRHLDLVRPTELSITTYYVVLLVTYGLIAFVFVRKALSIK
ncbi:PAQR8 [Branchiostoma lanceolatum]|uniref:PAQR8 protein n=1 Tax=Branchiostoma lanceolatum TaxID=7740 RepID=A0A8J9ZNZ4_BRALA|nr:PAQR8 [Branchiostoma lanceolatum]